MGNGKDHNLRRGGGVTPEGRHTTLPLEEADCEAGNQTWNVGFSSAVNSEVSVELVFFI